MIVFQSVSIGLIPNLIPAICVGGYIGWADIPCRQRGDSHHIRSLQPYLQASWICVVCNSSTLWGRHATQSTDVSAGDDESSPAFPFVVNILGVPIGVPFHIAQTETVTQEKFHRSLCHEMR